MIFKNPALQKIYENVVSPALREIRHDIEGIIISVDYEKQTATIYWIEPGSLLERQTKDIPLPRDMHGVIKQSAKIGDRVSIGFRNGSIEHPYISVVYRDEPMKNYHRNKFGGDIPKGIGYF